jgi:hypothetical protein
MLHKKSSLFGGMPERLNGLAWRAGVPHKGTQGSNPCPSGERAVFSYLFARISVFLRYTTAMPGLNPPRANNGKNKNFFLYSFNERESAL